VVAHTSKESPAIQQTKLISLSLSIRLVLYLERPKLIIIIINMTVSLPIPHVSFSLASNKFQKTRSEILFSVNFSKIYTKKISFQNTPGWKEKLSQSISTGQNNIEHYRIV
jgi:hypothetical protein